METLRYLSSNISSCGVRKTAGSR